MPKKHNALTRAVLIGVGLLFVAIGAIGVVLPGLPTTPFLILAVICFANAHPGLHAWLHRSKFFAPAMRQATLVMEKRAVSLPVKIISQAFAWLSFLITFILQNAQWNALTISIFIAALLSSIAMASLKTLKE